MGTTAPSTVGIAALAVLLTIGSFPMVTAQDAGEQRILPEKLWETNPSNAGVINDVAIDADGKVIAAVAADAGPLNSGDDEVFAWDLSKSKTSTEPVLRDDPRSGALDPEGMKVVGVEPRPGEKARYIAVGNEGAQAQHRDNVYSYRVDSVGEPGAKQASQGSEGLSPVQDLIFSEDGSHLLVVHEQSLMVLVRDSGEYKHVGQWPTPGPSERIIDHHVTRDLNHIALVTRHDGGGTSGEINTYLRILKLTLDDDGGTFADAVEPRKRTEASKAFTAIAMDEGPAFVAAGTENNFVLYYELRTNPEAGDGKKPLVWSTPSNDPTPAAVREIGMATDGRTFAAGFQGGDLRVYGNAGSDTESNAPILQRISNVFDTRSTPTKILFTNQDTTLFVGAGSLYAFNEVQFGPDATLNALWIIPQASVFDASRDGNRLVVASGENVAAYEQKYSADMELGSVGQATPGKTLSIQVGVANTGSAFDEYTLSVQDLPGAWSAEISPPVVSLLPGRSETVTLNLTPDKTQAPGPVELTLEAQSRFSPSDGAAGEQPFTVQVREVRAAGLSTQETTIDAQRGATATLTAELTNEGNIDDTFRVSVTQDRSWDVTINGQAGASRTVDVDAGGTSVVTMGLAVPSEAGQGSANAVTLTARPEGGGTEATLRITILVEPSFGAALVGPTETLEVIPGEQATFEVTLRNTGNTDDTFTLSAESDATDPNLFWQATVSNPSVELSGGDERTITVTVSVPRGAEPGDGATVTLAARSAGSGSQEAQVRVDLQAVEADGNGAPLPLVLAPIGLLLAAALRRRRT